MKTLTGSSRLNRTSVAWICALLFGMAPLITLADDGASQKTGEGTRKEAPTDKQVARTPGHPEVGGEKVVPTVGDSTNALKRVHAFVSGKVQGVGFRNFTTFSANGLKLKGWVKNLEDGRVELVAEGPAPEIEKLMEAVAKGPSGARVDKVDRKEEPHTGEFKRFETDR